MVVANFSAASSSDDSYSNYVLEAFRDPIVPFRKGEFLEATEQIGRGGWGVVFKAETRVRNARTGALEQPANPEVYAVKALLHPRDMPLSYRQRVANEIAHHRRAAARTQGVVRVVDVRDERPELLFIILEFCAGGTLNDAICYDYFRRADGALDNARVKRAVLDVLDTVAACHAEGIYHRDLKPDNVLLDATGRARLCDFGISTREKVCWDMRQGTEFCMPPGESSSSSFPDIRKPLPQRHSGTSTSRRTAPTPLMCGRSALSS